MKTKSVTPKAKPAKKRGGAVTISVYWDTELHEKFGARCESLKTSASARLRLLALKDLGVEA